MSQDRDAMKKKAKAFIAKKKPEQALALYGQLLKQDPSDAKTIVSVGNLYNKMGRKDDALRAYLSATKYHAQSGELMQAIATCKMVLAIDPNNHKADALIAHLYAKKQVDDKRREEELAARRAEVERTRAEEQARKDAAVAAEQKKDSAKGALPEFPLFSELPEKELQDLITSLKMIQCDEGEVIIQQGAEGTSAYILASGGAEALKHDGEGGYVKLGDLKEGDFFGEIALFTKGKRTASIRTTADSIILELDEATVKRLGRSYPSFAEALRGFYHQRLLTAVLRFSAPFRPISDAHLVQVVKRFRHTKFGPGDVLSAAGLPANHFLVIETGTVNVVGTDGTGGASTISRGGMIGAREMLTNVPYAATYTAASPVVAFMLDRERFSQLVDAYPSLAMTLAKS